MRCALVALALIVASPGARAQGTDAPATPTPATDAITPPEVVEAPEPLYPPDAFLEGVAGDVLMDIDIDDEGVVTRAWVKASPDPRLTWAALGAATNMSFVPAQQGAQSIFVRIEYKLSFTIDEVVRERMLAEEEARQLAERAETAPVNLRGRVLVAGERLAVPGAFVSVEGTELETVTDDDGAFELRGVPEGKRAVHVEAGGFLAGYVSEDFQANVVVDVNLYLERRPGAQDETVVYARRTEREVTKRVLTQKELQRVPGTFGDAVRVVQRLPGVARAPFGIGALVIRGGSPEDSTILIDGHLSRMLFHLGAGPSVINTDLVERLELYPGGQGARFGRAIAGAVDVVTRDPRTDTFAGQASVDLLQTSFRLEGPLTEDKKVGFFLAGRKSYVAEVLNIGDLIVEYADTDMDTFMLAPRYTDYQAKLVWKLPYQQTLALNFYGSDDDLDLAFDAGGVGPMMPTNVGVSMGFWRVNPVWRIQSASKNGDGTPKLKAFVSPMVETNYSENRFDSSQFRLEVLRGSLRAEVELRPMEGLGLVLGTDDTVANFHSVTDVPLILPDERLFPRPATSDSPRYLLEEDVLGSSGSFYAEVDATLGGVMVVLGGRADLFTYYDEVRTSFDPRLAVRWTPLPQATLKGSLGVYHQTPSPFELANKFGNPKLPLEHGVQASVGAEVDLTRSLEVDVQTFLRHSDDLAEFVVSPLRFFASGAARIQPVGEQRVYGAELLLRQRLDQAQWSQLFGQAPWGKSFGWIAYTLMRAENRGDAPVGVEGGEPYDWELSDFDQTHIFSLAASTEIPWGLEVGAAVRFVTGLPDTFAHGGIYDADVSRYRSYDAPYNSSRIPPFFQLDLRVDKRWVFDTWSLAAFLDLQNATNQRNFEFYQYNYDYTQVQGFPGLPIIPVFGVDAKF